MMAEKAYRVHPSAEVSAGASIGAGTSIWHQVQIREGVIIGENCIIGKDVYIDFDVRIGNNVKIQNSALIYHGAEIEDGVFIGPQACLTNDLYPRAVNPDGDLKSADDWVVGPTMIRYGASVGAGALVLPDVEIGRFALIGAGAVVTKNVAAHALVVGNPARVLGYVCECARRLEKVEDGYYCSYCDRNIIIKEHS